jgi:hypothetical protein
MDEAIMIVQGRASYLNRGPPAASGMRILGTSFDALQHCLNQLEVPTMERIPHGDVPFLGTAESVRHELIFQQCLASPHGCMENRRSHLDQQDANTPCCIHGLQVQPRVMVSFIGSLMLASICRSPRVRPTHHVSTIGRHSFEAWRDPALVSCDEVA